MQLPEQIETKRLILKHPEKPTFELAKALYQEVDKSRHTLEEWLFWVEKTNTPEDEFTGFLLNKSQKNWQEGIGFAYIIYEKETNKILGTIDLFNICEESKSGEIGYWLTNSAVGKGYMQEALRGLESEGFKAGINRIVIKNDTQNLPSANVAKRANYVLDGVLRQNAWDPYHKRLRDTNIWSKLKSEWEKEKE